MCSMLCSEFPYSDRCFVTVVVDVVVVYVAIYVESSSCKPLALCGMQPAIKRLPFQQYVGFKVDLLHKTVLHPTNRNHPTTLICSPRICQCKRHVCAQSVLHTDRQAYVIPLSGSILCTIPNRQPQNQKNRSHQHG